ncbi:acyltransferase [Streptomyces sp. NPDC048290]|uniref:acyltransferase family protein n=1 Tax=Streptomyces sp. NPDC048290 TaxID=3155811 RepID=UPI003428F8DE
MTERTERAASHPGAARFRGAGATGGRFGAALRHRARRVDAATPPDRDRAVDALRGFAILGVVLGHWLVTALVADGDTLRAVSPLDPMPWLAPVSWLFQTLAVFFLVGGHVATRSLASARARGIGYRPWLTARLSRLFAPVLTVLTLWTVMAVALLLASADLTTLYTLLKLALSPLWFLLVFAALTAATPLLTRLSPLWPLAVVLHVDLVRFGLGGPDWLGWVNLAAGWLVPYTLGAAWTRGELERPRAGRTLLIGGAVTTAGLVAFGGYPASMVGVPGAEVSNLNPPTLAAVTFGLAQCGLALLLRGPLRRWMRRPTAWAAVALLNLSAMTIFLWHQTAMMATTVTALSAGRLPGLHTRPDDLAWVAHRLAWLPVFAVALAVCWAAFRFREQGRPARGPRGRSRPTVVRARHTPAPLPPAPPSPRSVSTSSPWTSSPSTAPSTAPSTPSSAFSAGREPVAAALRRRSTGV